MNLLKMVQTYFRKVVPKAKPKVLQSEWDKELEELQCFAKRQNLQYRPESLGEIVKRTKFNAKEVKLLYKAFKMSCPSGTVSREEFREIFRWLFPKGDPDEYADCVFNSIDFDGNGVVNFEEFLRGFSLMTRGSDSERVQWIYSLYDVRKSDKLDDEDILRVVRSISKIMGSDTAVPLPTEEFLRAHAAEIFKKLDRDNDGFISREDFSIACFQDKHILDSLSVFQTCSLHAQ